MSTEVLLHNKLLSGIVIFSLPFLPFTGFFENKSKDEGFEAGKALSEKSKFVSSKISRS